MSADLVMAGGRVIDPLSGFDAVADVAVTARESQGSAPPWSGRSGSVPRA